MGGLLELVDAAMRSKIVSTVWLLWCLEELLLYWILFYYAKVDVPNTSSFSIIFLMVMLIIKTILFLAETALTLRNQCQICYKTSDKLTYFAQGVSEIVIEVPTMMLFIARNWSFCYLRELLNKPLVQGKLWIGLEHVFLMAFKWLLQIRHCWLKNSIQERKQQSMLLLFMACVFSAIVFGCRVYYLKVAYDSETFTCFLGPLILVVPENEKQVQMLKEMFDKHNHYEFRFCYQPRGIGDQVLLKINRRRYRSGWSELKKMFKQIDLKYETLEDDVQGAIEKEKQENSARQIFKAGLKADDFQFNYYHSLDENNQFLSAIAREYPNITQLFSIGNSVEGRPLQVMKLSAEGWNSEKRPGFWIDCGTHARDWIAPATCTFIIRELIRNHTETGGTTSSLLDSMVWYIMPIVNPDGYKYSWEKDRLWRKNRNPLPDSSCKGVDLNRNFDFAFGEEGASGDPCEQTYHGPWAFSEPETSAIAAFLTNSSHSVLVYINTHSGSQNWLIPFDHQNKTYPANKEELFRVAENALKKLKSVDGTEYQVGSTATLGCESLATVPWKCATSMTYLSKHGFWNRQGLGERSRRD